MACSSSSPHYIIFPFMSKGHTIPLLHLTHLLLHRSIRVTFITTPANSHYIHHSLSNTNASIIALPFQQNIAKIPAGVESTDQLPSISLFFTFASATKLLQPYFEQAVQALLPHVSCIISDGFLSWTLESASKFNIPRLVSYGMSSYPMIVRRAFFRDYPNMDFTSVEEPLTLKSLPWHIKLTKDELGTLNFDKMDSGFPFEIINEQIQATSNSWGLLLNTFYAFEQTYIDYWNSEYKPRAWCLGPLCLAEPLSTVDKSVWVQWLDARLLEGRQVLYIAFGSQVHISYEQLREIAIGLEQSGVNFLWVVRPMGLELENGFEERVKERGIVVREWVNQREILEHKCVNGFMSHCGWNSVTESISASVPILAWPMMAEQFLNAKLVVEELGVGLRIKASNNRGSHGHGGFVEAEMVEKMVNELMMGDEGKVVAEKVKEMGEEARSAMDEGGSSWCTLDLLIDEVCSHHHKRW